MKNDDLSLLLFFITYIVDWLIDWSSSLEICLWFRPLYALIDSSVHHVYETTQEEWNEITHRILCVYESVAFVRRAVEEKSKPLNICRMSISAPTSCATKTNVSQRLVTLTELPDADVVIFFIFAKEFLWLAHCQRFLGAIAEICSPSHTPIHLVHCTNLWMVSIVLG